MTALALTDVTRPPIRLPLSGGCPACGAMAVLPGANGSVTCPMCRSVWVPSRRGYEYSDRYPAQRGHHQAAIARCKQITLQSWLRRTGIEVQGRRVLEVGFGGGATLAWLQAQGAIVSGQEPVAANRAAAINAGIPAARVHADLSGFAGQSFDLVLYLDAFEHLTDPRDHLLTLRGLTGPGTRVLMVLPVADSLSRAVLRGWWPHDIDDHWVFYSRAGLQALWGAFGWRVAARFSPWKYVSLRTVTHHCAIKTGLRLPLGLLADTGLWLNFGERGLVFERSA